MTHDEAVQRELVEQYVKGRLDQAARQEFEQHFFACDECFAYVTLVDQLRPAFAADRTAVKCRAAALLVIAASVTLAGWMQLVRGVKAPSPPPYLISR